MSERKSNYEEEIKKIYIDQLFLDVDSAYLVYTVEGESKKRADNVPLKLTQDPSFISFKRKKPSQWYFINLATDKKDIYISIKDIRNN